MLRAKNSLIHEPKKNQNPSAKISIETTEYT